MKHITKFRAFQVCVVVENIENLEVGCCFYLCVFLCVWYPLPRCGFASRSGREVSSCLFMTHMKQTQRIRSLDHGTQLVRPHLT